MFHFSVQHPDPLRCYGEQRMITLILFRKVRVSHGAPPSFPQVLHDAAVERIVPSHLCYGNMQHVVQSLEDTEPEGDLRQLRVSRLHQPQYHICVIDVVREHSGEAVFISGVAVRAVKYVISLTRNARDPGNDVFLVRQPVSKLSETAQVLDILKPLRPLQHSRLRGKGLVQKEQSPRCISSSFKKSSAGITCSSDTGSQMFGRMLPS